MANRRRPWLPEVFELTLDEMLPSGECRGSHLKRIISVFGALPGERVRVRTRKIRGKYATAAVEEVLEPSPMRRAAREDHYLSCSPWQILPEPEQHRLKREFTLQRFRDRAGETPFPDVAIVGSEPLWGYRNKMEFSFTRVGDRLSLALHERGRYDAFLPLERCLLAHPRVNEIAQAVRDELERRNIGADVLKYLMVRYSYHEDACLADLYVFDPAFPVFELEHPRLQGWGIAYSTPENPTTLVTERLHESGRDHLVEAVRGCRFKLFRDSFFQVHPPGFEALLAYVAEQLPPTTTLLDLYAGVGTIGVCLAEHCDGVLSLEENPAAAQVIAENAEANGIANVQVFSGAAEKHDLEAILVQGDTLITDPPRTGLHPKVTKRIAAHGPEHFIYVSCNPTTQAIDYGTLKEAYEPVAWRLFDLYPQTPHCESVLVLRRRSHR